MHCIWQCAQISCRSQLHEADLENKVLEQSNMALAYLCVSDVVLLYLLSLMWPHFRICDANDVTSRKYRLGSCAVNESGSGKSLVFARDVC